MHQINLSLKFRLPHPMSTMSGNIGSAKTWFQSGTCAGTYKEKEPPSVERKRLLQCMMNDSLNQ